MRTLERVCVFCGSSPGHDPSYRAATVAFGQALARRGIELVYGGGSVGLMGVLSATVMSHGGRVTGVYPEGVFSKAVSDETVTTLHRVNSMHERKALMYELADAFIALPGGLGTLDELFETLTWAQIGLHSKPVGLLDAHNFYDDLLAFLRRTVAEGFVKQANIDLLSMAADPDELLDALSCVEVTTTEKWIDPDRI